MLRHLFLQRLGQGLVISDILDAHFFNFDLRMVVCMAGVLMVTLGLGVRTMSVVGFKHVSL